jgi:hypothetical protein
MELGGGVGVRKISDMVFGAVVGSVATVFVPALVGDTPARLHDWTRSRADDWLAGLMSAVEWVGAHGWVILPVAVGGAAAAGLWYREARYAIFALPAALLVGDAVRRLGLGDARAAGVAVLAAFMLVTFAVVVVHDRRAVWAMYASSGRVAAPYDPLAYRLRIQAQREQQRLEARREQLEIQRRWAAPETGRRS